MAINFPNNPNNGDLHSSGGKTWMWDQAGTSWNLQSTPATGIGYTDLSVVTEAAVGGGSLTYNDTNGQFTFKPAVVGSTTFIGLTDTPGTYTAGKWLKVNTGGTALEWTDAPSGNDTNDYLNTASLSGTTLTLTRTGSQSLSDVTVDLSSLNSVPTNITVTDESTETVCYPLFTTAATGNLEPKTGTNIKFNSLSGQLEAGSFKKTGGSSSEFLKADGSVDSTTYLSSNPSYALNDLSNVDATTNLANGKILKYDLGSTTWVVADDNASGGGSASFTGLSDTPSAHSNNKWLKSDGSALVWTDAPTDTDTNTTYDLSATASSGNAVVRLTAGGSGSGDDDVTFSSGGGISYNVTGNTIQVSSVNTLGGLSDTTITGSPTDNYVLTYDSATSKWEPQPVPGGLTIANNANNRIVTGVSGTSLHAEGNLTFDGTDLNVTGNATISGNLTVNGTQTIINTATLEVEDGDILLNKNQSGSPTLNGGITIERGTSPNVTIRWNETTDKWTYTNDGTNFNDIGSSTTDTDTTYDLVTLVSPGIKLAGSDSTNDSVFFDSGNGMSISRTSATDIEFSVNMIDEDDMASNSATRPPTQQSVKAYVDNNSSTNTNTTYDLSAVAVDVNSTKIRLAAGGSGSGNDDVTLSASGGIQYSTSGNNIQITSLNNLGTLTDVNFGGGSPSDNQVLQYDSSGGTGGSGAWVLVNGSSLSGDSIPTGTIVMFNGTAAPTGWGLCDGGGGRPDLRDKFIVGAGNSYNSASTGGYTDSIVVSHGHNTSVGNQSANHTHGDGNYGTNNTGDHYHQQSGSGSGTTGTQSANHYHTIGSNKPDGSPGTWNANTSGGSHQHGIQTASWDNQSDYNGPYVQGGTNAGNVNTKTGTGAHNHTINLTGVTTGGVDQNHTHNFNFNIGGNTTYSSIGDHAHNVTGSSGNQSSNHNHNVNIVSNGSSGSGRNLPPYYAITFIIKL